MGVQSSRTSHSSELWGLCHRKDWNRAWSLLLSLPTLTDSEQLPTFLGQGYFGTTVRLSHKHYNTVAAQRSEEPQYWSEYIPWSAVQSAVCQYKVLRTKTNYQLLPREPWSGLWKKFKIHLQSILRLSCCDWNWLVCLVCGSSEDFRSSVPLTYSHPSKPHEEGSKDALPSLSSFRVGYQTFQASHLVPETDRGLQERGHHRPDVLLEQWHGPLCPHPQIQASADVGISPGLQRCCSSYLHALIYFILVPLWNN